MGCSSSSSTSSNDVKNNEFVVDDISDPTKVKAPIEVAHPTYSIPASQRNGSGHDVGTSSGKSKKKSNNNNNQIATTAADTVTTTTSPNDARSRYALQDEPATVAAVDDVPTAGGLPGLGGLPSFQPRRYEDVHPPGGGGGDDDEEEETKPQGDQVVTDLFRRYADNARGGVRPKTVVMKPPSATFGTFSTQTNSRPNSMVPIVGEEDDTTTTEAAATTTIAPTTAASTASGTGNMDENDHTEVSSSRIGGITMNPARRSHSESSRHGQRSRHSTTTTAASVPVPGAVMEDTVATTVVGTAKASSRHDDDEFG